MSNYPWHKYSPDHNKRVKSLSTIWNVLWEYRDNPDVRMESISDDQWNDITEAMSFIHEELGEQP